MGRGEGGGGDNGGLRADGEKQFFQIWGGIICQLGGENWAWGGG